MKVLRFLLCLAFDYESSSAVVGSQWLSTKKISKGEGLASSIRTKRQRILSKESQLDTKAALDSDSNKRGNRYDEATLHSTVLAIRRGGASAGRQQENSDDEATAEKSTIASSVFNLVNNVAGAGILTLAAGMAPGTGWIPALFICATLGLLSGHTFSLIGEACELTGEEDFKGLWGRTIGTNSQYLVDTMIGVLCLACCVIYSGILGDVFTPLLTQAGLPRAWNGRRSNILVLTTCILLPLSLIRNLSALAFTSILGFSSVLYTVIFVVIRSLDGTYASETGKFVLDGMIAQPAFTRTSLWNFDFTSLVLASNLGLAYIAHYNGPTFYKTLLRTNTQRFRRMVHISFAILVLLYSITMAAGYSTFGDVCQGNILLNYHPNDVLSTFARFATGLSILFGYPLVATGAREAIIGACSSFGYDGIGKKENHFLLVSGLLAFVTTIACTVDDVSLVVGLTGAALGSFIVYICPSIIYTLVVKEAKGEASTEYRKARWNLAFVPFGLGIASLGCYMTIKEAIKSSST